MPETTQVLLRRGLLGVGAALLAIAAPVAIHLAAGSSPPVVPEAAMLATPVAVIRAADFADRAASPDARHLADWIAASRDNGSNGFLIVDKKGARVYVFDSLARLRGDSAVLLGAALGDDTVPGIGTRPIPKVLPLERTTPAGRFVAERGRNARGEDVVWIDYDAAVSMHRVLTTNAAEHRLERLATASVDDNRISYGCINVPVAFYEAHVRPIFATERAIIYVLPDVKTVEQVFGMGETFVAHYEPSSSR